MSEEISITSTSENLSQAEDWRAKIKELGKRAFELAEMQRLGFWPPSPDAAARTKDAEAELKALREEMQPLKKQLRALEKEIAEAGDIQKALAEIRTLRIERVKRERTEGKIRKAREGEEKIAGDKAWRASTLPHLGPEVSKGLNYDGGDDGKLLKLELPVLKSAEEVAGVLGILTSKLAWLTYHRGATTIDHYHHFQIPKRSGGSRNISAPKKDLKAAQRRLLDEVLARVPVHESAAAFLPGKNIAHNAARHAGAEVLVRLDLKDFFPSITFKRVKKTFQSLGYNEGVSTLFALLCTEAPRVELSLDGKKYFVAVTQRFLPQGASTSPALTNILCRDLDARLAGGAKKLGFEYSRYADDLVFSSENKNADARALLNFVAQIIADEKFQINEEKTVIMRAHRRQSVTGLVVNASDESTPLVRLSQRDLKNFRAFLHHYEKRGREAMTEKIGQDALSYARGYWAFIHMVSPERATQLRAKHTWLKNA
jgi:RNA-directed DNA polymerase